MPTWELAVGSTSGSSSFSTTNRFPAVAGFLTPSLTESGAQLKVFSTYTWANFYVRCLTWLTANHVLRSRVGGLNGNMTVTVTGTGVFQDTINTDSLVSGNLINYIAESSSGAKTYGMWGSTLQDTGTNAIVQMANQQSNAGTSITFGITRFGPIAGRLIGTAMATTETDVQYTIRRATTYTNLRVSVRSNTFDGATTWAFRVDAGAGAQSVSIAGGTTGAFEDTTNSDVVAAASEVNHSINTTASTLGVIFMGLAQVAHISTSRETATAIPIGGSNASDRYYGAEADGTSTVTESDSQIAARAAFIASSLFVNITAHGASSGVNYFLRQNTGNSALTVNVPASETGLFENTADSVSIAVADVYNYFQDHGGGAGGITPTIIGMAQGPTDAISGGGKGYPGQMHNRRPRSRIVGRGLKVL